MADEKNSKGYVSSDRSLAKIEATTKAAYEIIQKEKDRETAKIERLRDMRLRREKDARSGVSSE